MMWDIDQVKPLSAIVVLSFIHSELSPFYGIIREEILINIPNQN